MSNEFDEKDHSEAAQKFIDLANGLAADGMSMNIVSAALMTASCTYATFTHVGDAGVLTADEVEQFADAYRSQLAYIQDIKRQNGAG